MPGFDKTGPDGRGSASGRGMGNCQTADATEMMPRGRRGQGGFGHGGGRGLRQGFGPAGRGGCYCNPLPGNEPTSEFNNATPTDDKAELQNQINTLKMQLTEIKELIIGKTAETKE